MRLLTSGQVTHGKCRRVRKRGDVTLWFDEDAIDSWNAPMSGRPGGQRRYSELAIVTALTLRTVFKSFPTNRVGAVVAGCGGLPGR